MSDVFKSIVELVFLDLLADNCECLHTILNHDCLKESLDYKYPILLDLKCIGLHDAASHHILVSLKSLLRLFNLLSDLTDLLDHSVHSLHALAKAVAIPVQHKLDFVLKKSL